MSEEEEYEIEEVFRKKTCPKCGCEYPAYLESCPNCGSKD